MLNKPSPRLAILRAQAAAQAKEDEAYKARCTAFESGDHALPFDFSAGFSKEVVGGFVFCAESGVDHGLPVLGPAKLVGPEMDWLEPWGATVQPARPLLTGDFGTWHSEPPPVPGVYVASTTDISGEDFWRHWDGKAWSAPGDAGDDVGPATRRTRTGGVMWLRLVSLDPAPASPKTTDWWRRGSDVPQAERVGLWHYHPVGSPMVRRAVEASKLAFKDSHKYRPAAPGVQEGDEYDESRYATQERYFVCVESYIGSEVGDVSHRSEFINEPNRKHWLPCDKDGWVTHVPTPTSTCPVPDGLRAGVRFDQGSEWPDTDPTIWNWSSDQSSRIVAWRPVRGEA